MAVRPLLSTAVKDKSCAGICDPEIHSCVSLIKNNGKRIAVDDCDQSAVPHSSSYILRAHMVLGLSRIGISNDRALIGMPEVDAVPWAHAAVYPVAIRGRPTIPRYQTLPDT